MMEGYESKIALCVFCQCVISANLLTFVKNKKTPHPTPAFASTPSNTLNQTHTSPAHPSLLSYMVPKNKQIVSVYPYHAKFY